MSSAAPHRASEARGEIVGGRFRVVRELGRGGMASVVEVEAIAGTGRYALKRSIARGEANALRFRREFHTLAQLEHPNIVAVHEYGVDGGQPYYTMDLLEGGPVVPEASVAALGRVLRDLCAALAFLHARRLLHRDLSLRNVHLHEDGRAVLIDFGILSTVGVTGEVVGTLAYLAPEAVLRLPLDHRADLYGLGALAYRLLAGRHAYPSRSMVRLASRWEELPAPPSHHRPGVPEALDDLVMRLLSRDPLARPSAAEVIERLEGVFDLPAGAGAAERQGWLQSTVLVGRQAELARVQGCVEAALDGGATTSALVVEAPSGMGKSRMLQEVALRAQTAGATVLRVHAGEQGRPMGVLQDAVEALLAVCEDDARDAASPEAAILASVLPELARGVAAVSPLGDPAEDRLRLHEATMSWLRRLGARRPLAWIVDDVQRADEASVAILTALAAEGSAFVVVGLRTDEAIHAPGPIEAFRERANRIELGGLSAAEVAHLVATTFGDIPDAARIGAWLHRVAGGSPMWCLELARSLVDDGVLELTGGAWTLVADLDDEAAAGGLADALEARVARLPMSARALGEALGVRGGPLSLPLCARLAGTGQERLLEDLAVLQREGILLGEGDVYRVRHDGLREALVRGLSAARRSALHRRAAEALLATAPDRDDPQLQLDVGWHLHAAGERRRAARWLERGGRQLYRAHAFVDAMAPLERALEELEGDGADPGHTLELRQMLLRAGVFCDREVLLRLSDDTIAEMARRSGVPRACALEPRIGGAAAVAVGLAEAAGHWLRGGCVGPAPVDALTSFMALVGYRASVAALGYDLDRLDELMVMMRPFVAFRGRIPSSAAGIVRSLRDVAAGRFGAVFRRVTRIVAPLRDDRLTPLPIIDRRMAIGAAEYMVACSKALDHDPNFERHVRALRNLDLRFFETGMAVARLFFHRVRGEEQAARAWYEKAAVGSIQLGNGWVFQSQLAWMSSIAYGWTRDVLGLKRAIVQLERHAQRGYRFQGFLALARGEQLRERGQLEASAAALDEAEAFCRDEEVLLRQLVGVARAERALAAHEPGMAREAARGVLQRARDPAVGLESLRLRAERALALAKAGEGAVDEALSRLDRALDEAARFESPVLTGSLHEAAARVALVAEERPLYLHHHRACREWFGRTDNPALLGRVARLDQAGATPSHRGTFVPPSSEQVTVAEPFSVTTGPLPRRLTGSRNDERCSQALQRIVEASGAEGGFLLGRGAPVPRVLAPRTGDEPDAELLLAAARVLQTPGHDVDDVTLVPTRAPLGYRMLPLMVAGGTVAVAAVRPAAAVGDLPLLSLLTELAEELHRRGDLEP